jgi:hypothetical protein
LDKKGARIFPPVAGAVVVVGMGVLVGIMARESIDRAVKVALTMVFTSGVGLVCPIS